MAFCLILILSILCLPYICENGTYSPLCICVMISKCKVCGKEIKLHKSVAFVAVSSSRFDSFHTCSVKFISHYVSFVRAVIMFFHSVTY